MTYHELCAKARAHGWHVHLRSVPGGPALITDKPTRIAAMYVTDQDDLELGFVYINPNHTLDEAAALLNEELEKANA